MNPLQRSNLLYLRTIESINAITAHVRSLHATLFSSVPSNPAGQFFHTLFAHHCTRIYHHDMGPQAHQPLFVWPLLFLNPSIGLLYSEEEIQLNITGLQL